MHRCCWGLKRYSLDLNLSTGRQTQPINIKSVIWRSHLLIEKLENILVRIWDMGAVYTILSMISMTTFKSLQMMWFDIKMCPQHGLEGLQQSVKHLGWEYQAATIYTDLHLLKWLVPKCYAGWMGSPFEQNNGQTNPSYPFTLKGDRVILTPTGNTVRGIIFCLIWRSSGTVGNY